MRLHTIFRRRRTAMPGILIDGRVFALADLAPDAPQDMRDVIADWDRVRRPSIAQARALAVCRWIR